MTSVKPRLVYIVTAPITARTLLRGQLGYMQENGFDVTLICGGAERLDEVSQREGIRTIHVDMDRSIRPPNDLLALTRLVRVLNSIKPDIVNASTPKAGLLGMLAARTLRIRHRIYVVRGLRLEGTTGILNKVLYGTEWLTANCAHEIICVGESLRREYVTHGLASDSKIRVFGKGSSNGVDVSRFERTDQRRGEAIGIRKTLGIGVNDLVFGFVGRFTRDKGISDLVEAYQHVTSTGRHARLLLVGDFDDTDAVSQHVRNTIEEDPNIVRTGLVSDVAPYYSAMDALVLPSYREGFPNVPLEAACAGVPTVTYTSTGCIDAVVDGVTGKVVLKHDVSELGRALKAYCDDRNTLRRHGEAAEIRVRQHFRQEDIWRQIADTYRSRLMRG